MVMCGCMYLLIVSLCISLEYSCHAQVYIFISCVFGCCSDISVVGVCVRCCCCCCHHICLLYSLSLSTSLTSFTMMMMMMIDRTVECSMYGSYVNMRTYVPTYLPLRSLYYAFGSLLSLLLLCLPRGITFNDVGTYALVQFTVLL